MTKDYMKSPSENNPKGYTITSWEGKFETINKADLNESKFNCPIFWKNQEEPFIDFFNDPLTTGKFLEDKIGFARSWGDKAKQSGCWIHIRLFNKPEEAKKELNLRDEWFNSAKNLSLVRIKKGAIYLKGGIKGGSGEQLFIHSDSVAKDLIEFIETIQI